MNRRNFLKGILAAGAAPAIVKAENLMKIWVPPEVEIIREPGFLTLFTETQQGFSVGSVITLGSNNGHYKIEEITEQGLVVGEIL